MNATYKEHKTSLKPRTSSNKKRLFIIDDDVSLTQAMKINLEVTGNFVVAVCNESDQALVRARAFHPDIILLDLVMPGLDGGDLSNLLEQDPSLWEVPVIMVTALVSNREVGAHAGLHSGHHLMIAKPIQFGKLLYAIDTALSHRTHPRNEQRTVPHRNNAL